MRRGTRARGAASLLLVALAATFALALEARGGEEGAAASVPGMSLAWASRNAESLSSGRALSNTTRPTGVPFRLALPRPSSRNARRVLPVVAMPAARRNALLLLRLSFAEPLISAPVAGSGRATPEGKVPASTHAIELRARTVLKYSVSSRIYFVGQAQGGRQRMLRITLARLFGGVDVAAGSPRDRYSPLSESEAALLRARERTVQRALEPRLNFAGFSLNLSGISVQAGVRVRVF